MSKMLDQVRGYWSTSAVICVAILLCLNGSLGAWEEDLHYGLTFWLATQAGFSRDDADQIAKADQSYDESEHTSAIPTVLWIILSNDVGAARDLQLKHFPSDAPLPSPPLRRAVAPNGPTARKRVEAALNAGDSATALVDLGEALHPFQDSWSHQGVPDIPYNLKPNLISAHPQIRGGWKSHDADLTYLHVDETLDVARETYLVLERFLNRNVSFRRRPTAPWATIQPAVRAFASAHGPSEKAVWASRYIPEQASTLQQGAADGGQLRVRALSPPMSYSSSLGAPLTAADQSSLRGAAQEFLQFWLVRRDVDAAIRYVDLASVAAQFAGDERMSSSSAVEEWSGRFLTIQLIDDHAAVNDAGHGDPSHARYSQLPRRPTAAGPFKATRTGDAPSISSQDFLATDLVPGGFALVLANDDARHDALTLVWQRIGGRWLLVRLLAIPD